MSKSVLKLLLSFSFPQAFVQARHNSFLFDIELLSLSLSGFFTALVECEFAIHWPVIAKVSEWGSFRPRRVLNLVHFL